MSGNSASTSLPTLYANGDSGRCIRISDLQNPNWKRAFDQMEAFSVKYLEATRDLPMDDYWWPADPLHCWSRLFEYPYVLDVLETFQKSYQSEARFRIADFGAAVTFFSYLMLERGFALECLDLDPRMPPIFDRVRTRLTEQWKTDLSDATYHTCDATNCGLQDASMDAVISVSVLEHTSDPPAVVREMARICKPGGLLVLTLDVAMSGTDGLSRSTAEAIGRELATHFEPLGNNTGPWPDQPLQQCLTNWVSPGSLRSREALRAPQNRISGRIGPRSRARMALRAIAAWPYRQGQEIARISGPQRFVGRIKHSAGVPHGSCLVVYCGAFRKK